MKYPNIQLKFDRKLDQDIAWQFYSDPEFGGTDFWQRGAIKHHPKLKELDKKDNPKEHLQEYILSYYNSKSDELDALGKKTKDYVNETKQNFFKIVDKIFNKKTWPQENYTGIYSIFDFCPRFLDWGGFQVFLYDTRNLQLFTVYHEMLHFIFYDYALKTFPEIFTGLDTENGKFWDLAEVFNAVIQQTQDFINLHGRIKEIGYPDHKNLIIEGRRIWEKTLDVKKWIQSMLPLL